MLDVTLDYLFDDRGYFSYIFLNGDETQVDELSQALSQQGVVCQNTGHSHRPGYDGRHYRWFIRVAQSDGSHPTHTQIGQAIRAYTDGPLIPALQRANNLIAGAAPPAQDAVIENVAHEAEEVQVPPAFPLPADDSSEVEEYRQQLHNAQERVRKLIKQFAAEQQKSLALIQQSQTEKAELEAMVQRLETEKQLMREQLNELAEEQLRIEEFVDEAAANERRLDELRVALDNERQLREYADQQVVRLQHELDRINANQLDRQDQSERQILAECLFPNVTFIFGSMDVLTNEIDDIKFLFMRLREIVYESKVGKQLQAAREWLELHFSTGTDDNGRIYYLTPNKTGDGTYHMLISFKKFQQENVRQLRRYYNG